MTELHEMPICVVTRFSYFGQSGWKSASSQSQELLFSTERLSRRLSLFASIALPSLAAQSDQRFHHMILTSRDLPRWARQKLKEVVHHAYDDAARYSVVASRPGPARKPLRQFLAKNFPDQPVAQVVLDDDDGLAADFMTTLRGDLASLQSAPPADFQPWPYFISYAKGYGLVLPENGAKPELYAHRYPYINAGLTLIGRDQDKNILSIDHRAAPKKFGARLVHGAPMFLRSVHDTNDSRVEPTARWRKIEDWSSEAELAERFPCLFSLAHYWTEPIAGLV